AWRAPTADPAIRPDALIASAVATAQPPTERATGSALADAQSSGTVRPPGWKHDPTIRPPGSTSRASGRLNPVAGRRTGVDSGLAQYAAPPEAASRPPTISPSALRPVTWTFENAPSGIAAGGSSADGQTIGTRTPATTA